MLVRGKSVSKIVDLCMWCREAQRLHPNLRRSSAKDRFAIAIYQIHQGIAWKKTVSSDESYAASIIHFIMTAEQLDAAIESWLATDILDFPHCPIDWKHLLEHISRAQQMIFYHSDKSRRAARYNAEKLAISIAKIVGYLFNCITPQKRTIALYDAMEIMTGVL